MSTREIDLAREELRALLALGIIGTLLALRDVLDINLGYDVTFGMIASGLMAFWGAYVFLTAIGVSDDFIRLRVADACAAMAAYCFVFGICATGGVVVFIVVVLVLVRFIGSEAAIIIGTLAASFFTLIVAMKIAARSDESA
jgi:hypothetical protein